MKEIETLQRVISGLDDFLQEDEELTETQMRKLELYWVELKLLLSKLKKTWKQVKNN